MSNRNTHVGNDDVLQRLDHEHLVALEKASRLMEEVQREADVEGESGATKTAWGLFESIGHAAASIPATSIEGLKSKARILAREGRGLTADEIIEEGGALKRLAASALKDVLAYGAYFAEPDFETHCWGAGGS